MHSRSTKDGYESSRALVRVGEAAAMLAVSPRSVWRLISIGEIATVRIGKSVRVTRAALDAFIAKGGAR